VTGLNVQARDDDDPAPAGRARFKMFECLACRGFHLVDPSTGALMAETHAATTDAVDVVVDKGGRVKSQPR
jgi:hypothetical protein